MQSSAIRLARPVVRSTTAISGAILEFREQSDERRRTRAQSSDGDCRHAAAAGNGLKFLAAALDIAKDRGSRAPNRTASLNPMRMGRVSLAMRSIAEESRSLRFSPAASSQSSRLREFRQSETRGSPISLNAMRRSSDRLVGSWCGP